jgi:quinol monooxygenase YgiN
MTIRVIARERIQSGKRDEALAIFRELIEHTQKEDGCIAYNLHQSVEDPDQLAMFETWASKEALDAHMQSEHFQRLIPQVGPLTEGEAGIEVYEEIL